MKKFYIPYHEKETIDFLLLFRLYLLAEYDTTKKTFSIIEYQSVKELAERLGKTNGESRVSASKVQRCLTDERYKKYFAVNPKKKRIELKNDIRGGNRFICLTLEEVQYLLSMDDLFLVRYYLYQRFYCGYNKEKRHNSTAKQILETMGYCPNSTRYIDKVSYCNKALAERGKQ